MPITRTQAVSANASSVAITTPAAGDLVLVFAYNNASTTIPTLEGTVKQKIPEGTQTDTTFRIKGKGMPRLRTNVKGDLVVTVRVEVPKRLSEKQKELLRQFDEATGSKENEKQKSFKDKVKDIFQ